MSLPTKSINKATGRGKLSAHGRGSGRGGCKTRGVNKAASGSVGSFYNHECSLLSGCDISNSAKSHNKVQEAPENLIFGDCQKDLLNESRISEVSQIYKSEYNSDSTESLNLENRSKKRSSRSASVNSERRNIFASDKK